MKTQTQEMERINKKVILWNKLMDPKSIILIGRESSRHYQYNEGGGRAFDFAARGYQFQAFDSKGIERYFGGEYYNGPVGKCRFCFTEINSEKRLKNQRETLRNVADAAFRIASSIIRQNIGNYEIFNGEMENIYGERKNIEKLPKTEVRLFRTVLKHALRGHEIYERQDLYRRFEKL